MTSINGHCVGQFEELEVLLQQHLETEKDIGASLSII